GSAAVYIDIDKVVSINSLQFMNSSNQGDTYFTSKSCNIISQTFGIQLRGGYNNLNIDNLSIDSPDRNILVINNVTTADIYVGRYISSYYNLTTGTDSIIKYRTDYSFGTLGNILISNGPGINLTIGGIFSTSGLNCVTL